MSKKLFKEIFKKYKTKIIKLINKYYEEKIKKTFMEQIQDPIL